MPAHRCGRPVHQIFPIGMETAMRLPSGRDINLEWATLNAADILLHGIELPREREAGLKKPSGDGCIENGGELRDTFAELI
jgi:hypothetical protein